MEVIWCVVILLALCFVGAVGSGMWLATFDTYVPFLNTLSFGDTRAGFEGFLTFWTFVIILQIIIPLSLYVTIEMTKLLQIYLIHQDEDMYDAVCSKSVECRALNIPEELGQVCVGDAGCSWNRSSDCFSNVRCRSSTFSATRPEP